MGFSHWQRVRIASKAPERVDISYQWIDKAKISVVNTQLGNYGVLVHLREYRNDTGTKWLF